MEEESQNRSRSASRRRRRQGQKQKQQPSKNISAVAEASEDEGQASAKASAQASAPEKYSFFDRIGGPETSMDGPVTSARAERGEIPGRGGQQMAQQQPVKEDKGKDGALSITLDLNIDIEIQLKASIHGDLTLSLL